MTYCLRLIQHFIEIKMKIKKDKEKIYIATPQGSLVLLALGHIGLIKWREAIENSKSTKKNPKNAK